MKVALLQYDIRSTKVETLDLLHSLIPMGVDLAVLPELSLTGFSAKPPGCATRKEDLFHLSEIAREKNTALIAGICTKKEGGWGNQAALITEKGVVAKVEKRRLFPIWKENTWFIPGGEQAPFFLQDVSISCRVCFDLRFPELFREHVGSPVFVVVANWPASRREHWRALLQARAIENQAFVVGVNRLGKCQGVAFCGDSVIYDYAGRILVDAEQKEGAVVADLDQTKLQVFRKKFPFLPEVVQ